jgi:hypothetical protein
MYNADLRQPEFLRLRALLRNGLHPMNRYASLAALFALSFGALALVAAQPTAAIDLRYHWASAPSLLMLIAFAARRLPSVLRSQVLGLGALLLSLIVLWWTWQEGMSNWNFIVGILPSYDASSYFSDAQRILAGLPISDASSRRPLFAAFFAALLGIAGNDLQAALLLTTLLVMAALLLCVRLLPTPHVLTTVFVLVIFLYYRRFIGTTLTEHLGLALGLMAFGCLVRGVRDRSRLLISGGMFLLALALNARAGAFFILPLLILWFAHLEATPGRIISWKWLAVLVVAVAAGFAANLVILLLMGGRGAAAFSNFAYTFYGLVYGGDWTLAAVQHPELAPLSANVHAAAIFSLALQHVLDQPISLLLGAIKAWAVFLPTVYIFAASHHSMAIALVPYFVLSVLAAFGLFCCLRDRHDPLASMILVALVGIWISVPFVPAWDSDQMRAYAATIPFLAWMPALGAHVLWATTEEFAMPASSPGQENVVPFVVLGLGAVVLVCLVLPMVVRGSLPAMSAGAPAAACPAGFSQVTAMLLPGTLKSVGMDDERPDLKSAGKLFIVNPAAGLSAARTLIYAGTPPSPSLLVRNALKEYAPASVRQFVGTLRSGERLGYAMVREGIAAEAGLRLVFLGRGVVAAYATRAYCAGRTDGRLGALTLESAEAP